jgi:UPF0716 protein FxsA
MHPFQILLLLFLAIPLVEIYFLIQVGNVIGPWPTIFLVVFTAVLGAWLLRIQGFATLMRVRSTMAQGGIPAMEMVEGAVLLVSGALLLTPGFFTDTIGFLCLIPALRRAVIHWALGRFLIPPGFGGSGSGDGSQSSQHRDSTTLEGEYRREDD